MQHPQQYSRPDASANFAGRFDAPSNAPQEMRRPAQQSAKVPIDNNARRQPAELSRANDGMLSPQSQPMSRVIKSPKTKESLEHNIALIKASDHITVVPRARTADSNKNVRSTPSVSRRQWTQPSVYMSADEIDNILRIQDLQTRSFHSYLEDFYFQNVLNKASENHQVPTYDHIPLYEAIGISSYVGEGFQMEGVLGAIPGRSTKTPRPLLNLQNEHRTEREQHASVLMLIENAFDRILDIEDIDKLLRFPDPSRMTKESASVMNEKRSSTLQDLFRFVPLFTLDENTEQPHFRENAVCAWEEDQPLLKFLNTQKGRKMIARLLPLLPGFYTHGFLLFFMRNLCLILGILDQFPDESSKQLLPAILRSMGTLNPQQIQVGLQVLSHFHKNDRLLSILQTKSGVVLLQAMFHQVFMQMSAPVPPQYQSQAMSLRQQWFQTVDIFFRRFLGRFHLMFNTDEEDKLSFYQALFVLFLSWCNHVGPRHHKVLLTELAEKISAVTSEHQELVPLARDFVSALMNSQIAQ